MIIGIQVSVTDKKNRFVSLPVEGVTVTSLVICIVVQDSKSGIGLSDTNNPGKQIGGIVIIQNI
jgi:hypothetical protein